MTSTTIHSRVTQLTATFPLSQLFWMFAIAHLTLWTLIPMLVCPNAPLDVIEGYSWGREWLLGTYKHPPMQAWVLEILATISDRARWAHFFASQFSIVLAFWAVWQTGRRILGETEALIGVLLLEGIVYYNYTSPEFNPNVLQLPFWALIGLYFHRAVKNNRVNDWLLLGLWSAGGLYSKYSTGLLLVCAGALMVGHTEARQRLKTIGPWLALLVTMLLFLPHILWLINHNFMPLTYASDRLHETKHHFIPAFILSPLTLIVGQFLALLPMTLLFLVFCDSASLKGGKAENSFDRVFIDVFTIGPFLLTFLMSLAGGFKIHDMWGTPFWNFVGIWLMLHCKPVLSVGAVRRFTYTWVVIALSIPLIFASVTTLYPYISGHTLRVNFPGRHMAERVADTWHARYGTPLMYVAGDPWAAGNVAYYTPERPHVFMQANITISPWIDRHDMAVKGGVAIWCIKGCLMRTEETTPTFLAHEFPNAEIQPNMEIPRLTDADIAPAIIGWAIIPPQGHS